MNKYLKLININFLLLILFLLIPNFNYAKEILIYADSISYDEDQNIIAKGNAKIFQNNSFITSDLIIGCPICHLTTLLLNFFHCGFADLLKSLITQNFPCLCENNLSMFLKMITSKSV